MIITREKAREQGLKVYSTGKPCRRNHVGDRAVADGRCLICARATAKAWKVKNAQEYKKYKRAYDTVNKDAANALRRARRKADPDITIAKDRARAERDREKIRARGAASKARHRKRIAERQKLYAQAHQDEVRAYRKKYHKLNRPKIVARAKAHNHKRRAWKNGSGGSYTVAQIAEMLIKQKHKCAGCLRSIKSGYHIDHIQALSRGGSNDIGNIQLLCDPCNRSKGPRSHFEWSVRNGRLL